MKPVLYVNVFILTFGILASCSSDVDVNMSKELPEVDISAEDLAALRANYDTDGDGLSDHLVSCPDTPLNDQDGDGVCEVILSDINEDGCVNLQDQGILGTELRQTGKDLLADLLPDGVVNLLDVAVFGMENGQCQDNCPTVFNPDQNADACTGGMRISGIQFDFTTHKRLAPGSDNWALTWADDGHQYTNWGDGGGFGGTNSSGRVSIGVGRVEGTKDAYTGYNVNGDANVNAENPSSFSDGKSTTMFFMDGTMYMLVSPRSFGDDCGGGIKCAWERDQLYKSTDYGATWSEVTGTVWIYGDGEKIGFPHFVNMGQAYADAIDGYVYVSAVQIQDNGATQIQVPGELLMMRVPATTAAIEDKSQYEYFSGTPTSPAWSSSYADRQPILEDPDGFQRHSITYIPPLDRFLMLGPHTEDDTGNLKVWEAPKPWGPWTLVKEYTDWNIPNQPTQWRWYFWDVSPKWISSDGLRIVVVATGKNENDSWNTIEATLSTTPESEPQGNAPYPASSAMGGVSFDWSSHERRAPGSDNFPVTWGADGHQYTSWGDGGGFGGSNSNGRVSLGVARVEGAASSYTGINLNGGVNPQSGSSSLSGKSYGILSLGGDLYMWRSPGSGFTNWDRVDLYRSTDDGHTWTSVISSFVTESDGVGIPTILQFGQDYAGSRDQYVYSYFIDIQDGSSLSIQAPGRVSLVRVPASQIDEPAAYEWFAGLGGSGQATWTSSTQNRAPVFEDPRGVGWNLSVIYNSGLDRYLLATEHSETMVGNLGIFDAPEPWGPWTTVAYEENWPSGGQIQHSTFFWNFSPKWWANGGRDFVLIFTGINNNDSWNTVRGSFTMP